MTTASPPGDDAVARMTRSRQVKIVGLVSGGHFFSHFYTLVLPPLFPLLKVEFGVSYTSLGLLVSAGSLASGLALLPVGFLVDRYGPVMLLVAGLAIAAAATLLMGFSSTYGMLLALVVLGGIGNSVFHPADYTLLSAAVRYEWLGRAFSVHTFAGHAGWAVAPLLMAALAATFGWRTGLVAVGLVGLVMAVVVFINRDVLRQARAPDDEVARDGGASGLRLLMQWPILTCFLFFVLIAMALLGIEAFMVSAFVKDRGISLSAANLTLTAMFTGSALGVLAGGIIADRTQRHSLVAATGLAISATLIAVIGASALPIAGLTAIIAMAGFASGTVAPSRDLIVRSVTPKGSTGKVFAFVSVGLDVGGVVAPPMFGWIMDNAGSRWVFWLTAMIMFGAIATVFGTRPTRGPKSTEGIKL
jgi:FSR family fosmidomycin resistance protein-like MFS transporter